MHQESAFLCGGSMAHSPPAVQEEMGSWASSSLWIPSLRQITPILTFSIGTKVSVTTSKGWSQLSLYDWLLKIFLLASGKYTYLLLLLAFPAVVSLPCFLVFLPTSWSLLINQLLLSLDDVFSGNFIQNSSFSDHLCVENIQESTLTTPLAFVFISIFQAGTKERVQ